MPGELYDIAEGSEAIVLRLHVQPRGGKTAVMGRHGDALKVKVGAPPEDGRANAAVVALIATVFGVAPDAVELVSGATSRTKRVKVTGITPDDAARRLDLALAEAGNAAGSRSVQQRHHRPGG